MAPVEVNSNADFSSISFVQFQVLVLIITPWPFQRPDQLSTFVHLYVYVNVSYVQNFLRDNSVSEWPMVCFPPESEATVPATCLTVTGSAKQTADVPTHPRLRMPGRVRTQHRHIYRLLLSYMTQHIFMPRCVVKVWENLSYFVFFHRLIIFPLYARYPVTNMTWLMRTT